eukprot:CAMPEP_0175937124 /NCGR_PEP_ID=MMETSP0108-20121206/21971_1 /TAXON_ID=195067 ORGANISM="Goniomonas pacifica, Strain CCMP1869" /NCGR_SAMPLE_ID=MMETSP0108 /ASSEMBLY_ACC=CAM_ASM_000204 /LENGTH=47 /DNA_ID= /DNA_START= /DNA_END= /DNA_ORIENTATION=
MGDTLPDRPVDVVVLVSSGLGVVAEGDGPGRSRAGWSSLPRRLLLES